MRRGIIVYSRFSLNDRSILCVGVGGGRSAEETSVKRLVC